MPRVARNGSAKARARRGKPYAPIDADAESGQLKLNELKKRLRDILRLMSHKQNMSAGERQYKQRELAALKTDIAAALQKKERKELISRYHMVRFFERRKAERLLKQAQKRAAAAAPDADDRAALQDAVHEAEVNVNYTMFAPLEQKYVSLFDSKRKEATEHGAGFRSPVWLEIESAPDHSALQKIRERNFCASKAQAQLVDILSKFGEAASSTPQAITPGTTKTHASGASHDADQDTLSDGGFFED